MYVHPFNMQLAELIKHQERILHLQRALVRWDEKQAGLISRQESRLKQALQDLSSSAYDGIAYQALKEVRDRWERTDYIKIKYVCL
jgi:hypothetical protein